MNECMNAEKKPVMKDVEGRSEGAKNDGRINCVCRPLNILHHFCVRAASVSSFLPPFLSLSPFIHLINVLIFIFIVIFVFKRHNLSR